MLKALKFYFPITKFLRALRSLAAFISPDDDVAQLEAVNATIEDLERQRQQTTDQLRILRWEKTQLEQIIEKKTSMA